MPTTNALRSINHFIELRIFSRSSTPQVKSLLPLKNLAKDRVDGKVVKATNLNHARLGVQPRQPVHRGERRVERVFLLLGKVRSRSRNGLGSFNHRHFLLGSSIMRFQSSRSPLPQSTSSSSSSSSLLAAGLAASVLMSNIPFSEEDYLL